MDTHRGDERDNVQICAVPKIMIEQRTEVVEKMCFLYIKKKFGRESKNSFSFTFFFFFFLISRGDNGSDD